MGVNPPRGTPRIPHLHPTFLIRLRWYQSWRSWDSLKSQPSFLSSSCDPLYSKKLQHILQVSTSLYDSNISSRALFDLFCATNKGPSTSYNFATRRPDDFHLYAHILTNLCALSLLIKITNRFYLQGRLVLLDLHAFLQNFSTNLRSLFQPEFWFSSFLHMF